MYTESMVLFMRLLGGSLLGSGDKAYLLRSFFWTPTFFYATNTNAL